MAELTFNQWLAQDERKDGCRGLSRLEIDQMRDAWNGAIAQRTAGGDAVAKAAHEYLLCVNDNPDATLDFSTADSHTRYDRARAALQRALYGSAAQPVAEAAVQADDKTPLDHIESCRVADCERCEALTEHYMACDECGKVGAKDADGWAPMGADNLVRCEKCAAPTAQQTPDAGSIDGQLTGTHSAVKQDAAQQTLPDDERAARRAMFAAYERVRDDDRLTPGQIADTLISAALRPPVALPEQIKYVPVAADLTDKYGNHPNDNEPRTEACYAALDARGDNRGQGLDPYWKWGFAAGFNAAVALPDAQDSRHPMQPLILDQDGRERFKKNAIVDYLAEGKLNDLAMMDFPQEDWEQLAQLIGYSLSGFGELSYVTDETYNRAAAIAVKLDAQEAGKESK